MSGALIWLTGRPAAGKSTLAALLADALRARGTLPLVLDGDEVRAALVPEPGYDPAERDHFYRTLGNLAALAAQQGLTVVVAATAHRRIWRDRIRDRVPRFIEVHVATPGDECRRRDPKRLYAQARPGLPGVELAYEPPAAAEVTAPHGADVTVVAAVLAVLDGATGPAVRGTRPE
jgi:adenylylsulfate kinase